MHTKRGYSLMEVLIVVAVLSIVSVLVAVSLYQKKQNAKLTRTTTELTEIATALTQYAEDNNYVYPGDVSRGLPPGLEKYLVGGVWPESAWPHGVFDYDNWTINGAKVYQISYRLCGISDPIAWCSDPVLFPSFTRNSSIFYCISGACVPHESSPNDPAYCVNCNPKKQNY